MLLKMNLVVFWSLVLSVLLQILLNVQKLSLKRVQMRLLLILLMATQLEFCARLLRFVLISLIAP